MRDTLLFVIALCLVLIVIRLYSASDFVREAQAQSSKGDVHLFACQHEPGETCNWLPVQSDGRGYILTSTGPK
jgi:hypothetical protein